MAGLGKEKAVEVYIQWLHQDIPRSIESEELHFEYWKREYSKITEEVEDLKGMKPEI